MNKKLRYAGIVKWVGLGKRDQAWEAGWVGQKRPISELRNYATCNHMFCTRAEYINIDHDCMRQLIAGLFVTVRAGTSYRRTGTFFPK